MGKSTHKTTLRLIRLKCFKEHYADKTNELMQKELLRY